MCNVYIMLSRCSCIIMHRIVKENLQTCLLTRDEGILSRDIGNEQEGI